MITSLLLTLVLTANPPQGSASCTAGASATVIESVTVGPNIIGTDKVVHDVWTTDVTDGGVVYLVHTITFE